MVRSEPEKKASEVMAGGGVQCDLGVSKCVLCDAELTTGGER